jgi:asparagine synthase (glutamine-hydrolysing)
MLDLRGRPGRLGHRRLAIVDLSRSVCSRWRRRTARLRVVYNGEIYNYPKLRSELEGLGHRFVSHSDTEVLLHGYREWGRGSSTACAGCLRSRSTTRSRRDSLLARDPLGIKPLYVADDGKRLAFASEVRALRAIDDGGGLDPEGLASYLLWGSIAPPRTLHRRIRARAGRLVAARGCERQSTGPHAYFRLEDELGRSEPMDADEAAARLREALVDTRAMSLDGRRAGRVVPVRGVDSSALVGLLSEVHDGRSARST